MGLPRGICASWRLIDLGLELLEDVDEVRALEVVQVLATLVPPVAARPFPPTRGSRRDEVAADLQRTEQSVDGALPVPDMLDHLWGDHDVELSERLDVVERPLNESDVGELALGRVLVAEGDRPLHEVHSDELDLRELLRKGHRDVPVSAAKLEHADRLARVDLLSDGLREQVRDPTEAGRSDDALLFDLRRQPDLLHTVAVHALPLAVVLGGCFERFREGVHRLAFFKRLGLDRVGHGELYEDRVLAELVQRRDVTVLDQVTRDTRWRLRSALEHLLHRVLERVNRVLPAARLRGLQLLLARSFEQVGVSLVAHDLEHEGVLAHAAVLERDEDGA